MSFLKMVRSDIRISGVTINPKKKIAFGMLVIYGIGKKTAMDVCNDAGVEPNMKGEDLTDEQISAISAVLTSGKYVIEADVKRIISENIKRLVSIKCYRGLMHRRGLPVRGQSTHSNARTRKGKKRSSR